MNYSKMFDITATGSPKKTYERSGPARLADYTIKPVYEYTPQIELAVNVALATGRPLLVRGGPGSGKSSLARAVADQLGWRYYEMNITSRTNAQDLLWSFDHLRRLNDSTAKKLKPDEEYIKPGPLWWAFNQTLAAKYAENQLLLSQPNSPDSVILLDEIDKAEPDVPNNLLLPLGSLRFVVDEIKPPLHVEASKDHPPLIFITTNEERQLPRAFLRRCIMLRLQPPDAEMLKKIAVKHFGKKDIKLYDDLAKLMIEAAKKEERSEPNAAEFLDAVWACKSLDVLPSVGKEESEVWQLIRKATLVKAKVTEI
jgi:MoxR-like ATPase